MNVSPNSRIIPLRRSVCAACIVVWLAIPGLAVAGIVWAVLSWWKS